MQVILLKIRYFERGLPESFKKVIKKVIVKNVNFIFSFEPSPFEWTKLSKNKRGVELLISSCYESSSEKLLYYLCLMMKYNTVFELFQNLHLLIYASQFMTS